MRRCSPSAGLSNDAYYGLVDFEFWARKNIGDEAVEYLKENVHPLDLASGWPRTMESCC